MKVRRLPITVDAIQSRKDMNIQELLDFAGISIWEFIPFQIASDGIYIHTLEGTMHCSWGDWIVKGPAGEFYPVKPDIFAQTHEIL